jgi:uncharacterized membrane protein
MLDERDGVFIFVYTGHMERTARRGTSDVTRKWSLFTKMVTFPALPLLAIAGLYDYAVAASINTVQHELETTRRDRAE